MLTAERVFSAMKLVMRHLYTKLKDGIFRNCVIVYTERKLTDKFSIIEEMIDTFDLRTRKADFKSIHMLLH